MLEGGFLVNTIPLTSGRPRVHLFPLRNDFAACTEMGWLSPVVLEISFSTLDAFLLNSVQQVFGPPEAGVFSVTSVQFETFLFSNLNFL